MEEVGYNDTNDHSKKDEAEECEGQLNVDRANIKTNFMCSNLQW